MALFVDTKSVEKTWQSLAEVVYQLTSRVMTRTRRWLRSKLKPEISQGKKCLAHLHWCIQRDDPLAFTDLVTTGPSCISFVQDLLSSTWRNKKNISTELQVAKLIQNMLKLRFEYKENEGERTYPIICQWAAMYYRMRNLPAFKIKPRSIECWELEKPSKSKKQVTNWIFLVQINK